MERQELLEAISRLDTNLLARLYRYSQLLIIPEEDLLINVNMSQMVDKAHQLADSFFPEWTDRSKSDFGQFLIEMMALFSEKDFWYINAFAHESLLMNTSVYSDAFVKAVSRGYRPSLCTGATAEFEVSFAPGAAKNYNPGDLVIVQDNTGMSFTNQEAFTVPDSPSDVSIVPLTLQEGTFSFENVTFNGHNIPLIKKMTDIYSIILTISNLAWDRMETFGLSGSGDKHYVVIPESDGRATIFFGEDGFGIRPNIGDSCVLKYRVTNGVKGNGPIQNTRIAKSNTDRQARGCTQTSPSTGGSDPETLAQIKNNSILFNGTKRACFNTYSTQQFLEGLNEVKQASVNIQGNTVYFYVIPSDGTIATEAFLNEIKNEVTPYLMNGYKGLALPTEYVNVGPITITVSLLAGTNNPLAVSYIKQLISDYSNPLLHAKYGQDFDLAELASILRSRVTGLQNVVFNVVAGGTAQNVVINEGQIMRKLLDTEITVNVINI